MNKNKICFISCVNNEKMYDEALVIIKNLAVPPDMEVETLAIRGQQSMTKGYNAAMKMTDAKYKVYLHQDVLIMNKNFIFDILRIFGADDKIGMMGIIGSKLIPKNGVWWNVHLSLLCGRLWQVIRKDPAHPEQIDLSNITYMNYVGSGAEQGEYVPVSGIDGLIMITQYDIPWREDIFTGWHFYDLSQSIEFTRQGYRVVVPKPSDNRHNVWLCHATLNVNYNVNYNHYRAIFLQEYQNDICRLPQ